jgi:hypothetical protein
MSPNRICICSGASVLEKRAIKSCFEQNFNLDVKKITFGFAFRSCCDSKWHGCHSYKISQMSELFDSVGFNHYMVHVLQNSDYLSKKSNT